MRIRSALVVLSMLATLPSGLAAQHPSSPDTLSVAAAGAAAGAQAGRTASVRGARWGSAAATFLLTPFIGRLGSLVSAEFTSGAPPDVPQTVPEASDPVFRRAYRETYQELYRPRLVRAVRVSVVLTTILFFVSAAAFAG